MNRLIKTLIGSFLLVVLVLILIRKFELLGSNLWVLISWCTGLLIAIYLFGPDSRELIRNGLVIGTFYFVLLLILLWFQQIPILGNKNISDTMMQVIFTFFIVVATVANVYISNRNFGLTRLTNIEIDLTNSFSVQLTNIGNFRALSVQVNVAIQDVTKYKNRVLLFILRQFAILRSKDYHLAEIFPNKSGYIDTQPFFEKELPLKNDTEMDTLLKIAYEGIEYSGADKNYHKYWVYLTLSFKSDTLTKIPFTIISKYEIIITEGSISIYHKEYL